MNDLQPLAKDGSNLPDVLDAGRTMLAAATDNLQRVNVRDAAKAAELAATVLNRRDIQTGASILVCEAERVIAKANPKLPTGGAPDRQKQDFSGEILSRVDLSRIRKAHEAVTDDQFDDLKAQAEAQQQPLTRKAILDLGKRAARAQREANARERTAEREARDHGDTLDIRHCECSGLMLELEPESVDAIITDPPYEKAAIGVYRDLRDLASKVLKPGGHLVALSGSMYLPQLFEQLEGDPDLLWRYLMVVRMVGATAPCHARQMVDGCKPILLYQKVGENKDGQLRVCNIFDSEMKREQEADHHVWQQSLDVFQHLLGKFASPGDVVCDPFLGGGTTGIAAVERGCHFIGADVNGAAVEIAKRRLGMEGDAA